MERSGKKVKAHIIYRNKEGKRLPGVTTVLGILNKPLLVGWANRIGLQGINVRDYVSDKADIGTLVHEMMFCDIKYYVERCKFQALLNNCVDDDKAILYQKEIDGTQADTSYYTAVQIEIAQNSFKKYLEWKKKHTIEPRVLEEGWVSEKFQYGGTIDNYCKIDGVPTLIDYKTCKGLYSEHFIQVSAYRQLLREHGYKVKNSAILRVGRSEMEGFEYVEIPTKKMALCWNIFKSCLRIHSLKKQLK